jgi:hypothetical protein
MDLRVEVDAGPDADAEEAARLASWLQEQLRELDVDDVSPVRKGPPPPGAKSAGVLAVGTLVVKVATSTGLASVVATIRSWLAGSRERSVKITLAGDTLEVRGIDDDEQRRLVDHFISRHSSP